MFHVEVALAQQPRLDDFQLLVLERVVMAAQGLANAQKAGGGVDRRQLDHARGGIVGAGQQLHLEDQPRAEELGDAAFVAIDSQGIAQHPPASPLPAMSGNQRRTSSSGVSQMRWISQ